MKNEKEFIKKEKIFEKVFIYLRVDYGLELNK